MLKYFTVITGLATLVGTFYLFLKDTGFYVALVLSFLFAIATLVAWYKHDRANRLKAIVYPFFLTFLKHIGAEAVPQVTEIAKQPHMQREVVDVLVAALNVKPNPTERYWIYVILGMIKSKKSILAIKRGLLDENEFARLGAKEAWKLIGRSLNGKESLDERRT